MGWVLVSSTICKVLKGLFITGWLCVSAPDAILGSTRYIDAGCSTNGNGTTTVCGGTNGAINSIQNAISLSWSAGDVFELRGAHLSHTGCSSSFFSNGVYRTDRHLIRAKNGSNGSPIVIQAYHYGLFDQEAPIIEGAGTTSVTWTRCTDCVSGDAACQNVPGLCSDYYYYYGQSSNNTVKAIAAVKPDGIITYRVSSKSDMNNSHAGFISNTCSPHYWISCSTNSDCPTNSLCTGPVVREVDSYSQETNNGYIVARWCLNGANCLTPGAVLFDNNGNAFDVSNSNYITIRGLNFRNFRREALIFGNNTDSSPGPSSNLIATNNTFAYSSDTAGQGSDYQIRLNKLTSGEVSNSYFAYSCSESIHGGAILSEASNSLLTITGNYIRDNGDQNVLGPRCAATPEGMTFTVAGSTNYDGGGNYAGSLIANNYIDTVGKNGIIIENNMHGTSGSHVTIRDNIISGAGKNSLSFACNGTDSGASLSYIDVYNNLLLNGRRLTGDGEISMENGSANCSIHDINYYNNTFYGPYPAITVGTARTTSQVFVNNLIFNSNNIKAVNFTNTDVSNLFQYNFVSFPGTAPNPAVTWLNTNRACADIDLIDASNIEGCPNPNFVNPGLLDFHINPFITGTLSKALDLGTTSLAARTTSINNTVAEQHGFPNYPATDGSQDYSNAFPTGGNGVDIGATELMVSDGGFESGAFGTGWTDDGTGLIDTIQKRSGTYSLRLVNAGALTGFGIGSAGITQTLSNLTVGTVYRIDGYALVTDSAIWSSGDTLLVVQDPASVANTYCNTSYYLGLTGSSNDTICELAGLNNLVVGGFVPFSLVFRAENSTTTLRFMLYGAYSANLWLDDFTVRPN